MRDAFTDFLVAVNNLAAGSVSESVIWGGEGRGLFIDMTLAHDFEVGLVIHEMADPNWLRPGAQWLPERARRLFGTNCAFPQLLQTLSDEVARVRDEYVDSENHMEQWGWDFPIAQHEDLIRNRILRAGE
jgi:hypothetical protein